jgi:hypothetical protein
MSMNDLMVLVVLMGSLFAMLFSAFAYLGYVLSDAGMEIVERELQVAVEGDL